MTRANEKALMYTQCTIQAASVCMFQAAGVYVRAHRGPVYYPVDLVGRVVTLGLRGAENGVTTKLHPRMGIGGECSPGTAY